jgi:Uma2 family endonuclease
MAAGASARHQEVSENLGDLIGDHTRRRRLGRLYRPRFDLILPGETAVEPDLMFVSAARRRIITPRGCEGPPDLVVEVLSPSNPRHDLERKRELYARHGVPEYLILEPYEETVLALAEPEVREGQGSYGLERLYRPGEIFTIVAFPGLEIAVADIFAEPW